MHISSSYSTHMHINYSSKSYCHNIINYPKNLDSNSTIATINNDKRVSCNKNFVSINLTFVYSLHVHVPCKDYCCIAYLMICAGQSSGRYKHVTVTHKIVQIRMFSLLMCNY